MSRWWTFPGGGSGNGYMLEGPISTLLSRTGSVAEAATVGGAKGSGANVSSPAAAAKAKCGDGSYVGRRGRRFGQAEAMPPGVRYRGRKSVGGWGRGGERSNGGTTAIF